MCWVPVFGSDERKTDGYTHKLTSERAVYKIEPAVKGLLLAVQTKMDLTFPTQLVKNHQVQFLIRFSYFDDTHLLMQ